MPEICYSILVDPDLQNLLQAFNKLVLVSQLNPFELFFDCRKHAEVTGGQIR
jgi:hypothetical protein